MAISKTTDTTIIAIHQVNNKTEITQNNNHADIVTEQISCPGIVKHVLIAEDWDMCLANVEHHDKIKTKGNKIRMLTKIHERQSRTQRKFLPATKYFKLDQSTSQRQHIDDTNEGPLTQLQSL